MDIVSLIITNLSKVGIGVALFFGAYLANVGLGAWKSVKIDGTTFDWKKIGQSIIKLVVLVVSIGLLTIAVTVIPAYATYVGITIEAETIEIIDAIVIIGAFLAATITYVKDALEKLKAIFS